MEEVLSDLASKDAVLRDYCDGNYIKNNTSFQKNTLFIVFYYDELEVANPLGSKRGIHKLGMYIYH